MDKIVLITGVSRELGLGYETAKQLKEAGYKVIATARDLAKVSVLADKIGVTAKELDITNDHSIRKLYNELQEKFGKIDVLINNAGSFFDQGGNPLTSNIEFIKDALDTNLLGAWRMIQAFHPLLKESDRPRIVNVSSGAGSFGDAVFGLAHHFSKVPVYGITKLALNGLTVKLASQFKDGSIKINSVDPGFTATYPGTEKWGARPVEESAKGIIWAATLPEDGPSGGFFKDGESIDW
ncbi:3-oxoacyl-[acyl-carrier-protein] reductase [Flagellimonas maritima]|uniref:3-oxoacyl-[acyl-carrier-protein] reductase n=1 Tax=Flagellimonas maritima TaxID=1383885 RepID=A0A2Z4LQG5_9FLAO|nr:SDR family NAD(P)-dependent oxidoreductase [Allomuricauda aurantiaca]AWX43648.1 3-oxoacyl-[acyl-carrier-protein] reductase [Allomuricauda aurantiaca]